VALCAPKNLALRAGDRGRAGDLQAGNAEGRRRGGDGAPGGHEVVDDHHPGGTRRTDSKGGGDELAHCRQATLSGGELGGVRPVGGQRQDRSDSDRDAVPAQDAGCMSGQSFDMLTAPAAGNRVRRRDRDEPHRPVREVGDRRRECAGQWPDEIAAAPLLVGQQA